MWGERADAAVDVFNLILKKRKAAVADLFKRQAVSGGVSNDQVNQAIPDYDAIKQKARRLGIAVPDGDLTLGKPEFSKE